MEVRHLPRVRRQHCRGKHIIISQDARVPGSCSAQRRLASTAASPAGFSPSTPSRISGRRSDTATPASSRSPHAPSPPVTKFQGAIPATGACASNSAPLSQGTRACASSAAPPATGAFATRAAPLSQNTEACALNAAPPATGARASSAAPLSYGIIQATGVCASGAAPLSLGTGPAHQVPPPLATRSAVVSLPRRHVFPFSEGVLLLHLPAMRWRSV